MNRYFDRLGSAFEEALARRAGRARRPSGVMLAAASFVMVAVVGAAWLMVRPLHGDSPGVTEAPASSTTTRAEGPAIAGVPLPSEWARAATVPAGASRLSLSGVTARGGRFVAVGSEAGADGFSSSGVVLISPDGVEWEVAARLDGLWLSDVAAGDGVLIGAAGRPPEDAGDVPEALVVTSPDGTAWTEHRLPVGPDAAYAEVFAVGVWDGGFIAAGSETERGAPAGVPRQRLALWISTDGVAWERIGGFPWSGEAAFQDVSADGPVPVAVGLVGERAGSAGPVAWRLDDGGAWREAVVPVPEVDGFTGMSAVAFGHTGYVAVGFAPAPGGSAGAVWVSTDGSAWAAVADPEGAPAGDSAVSIRMHDVAALAGGYVAVGSALDRPFLSYRIWTSPDGVSWRGFDLADPGAAGAMSSANAVAAGEGAVVVVGFEMDMSGTTGAGAVWIGPPGRLEPSAPIEPGEAGEPPQVAVRPARVVAGTRVWVRGSLGALDGSDGVPVWLVPDEGDPQRLCNARVLGSVIDCRVVIEEAFPEGIAPAVYAVALGSPDGIVEGVTLEVLPEGAVAVSLVGVYQPYLFPLLQSIAVRNDGGDPLDIGTWQIVGTGGTSFTVPDGTVLDAGDSFLLDFGYTGGGTCPAPAPRYTHWCSVLGRHRMDFGDADLLWRGGSVVLHNRDGAEMAEWSPPR